MILMLNGFVVGYKIRQCQVLITYTVYKAPHINVKLLISQCDLVRVQANYETVDRFLFI